MGDGAMSLRPSDAQLSFSKMKRSRSSSPVVTTAQRTDPSPSSTDATTPKHDTTTAASASAATDSIRDQDPCWKCQGHGRKRSACNSNSFTGKICPVCHGSGQRPASKRSLELGQQPGKIVPLRGRNGEFSGQRAVQGFRLCNNQCTDDISSIVQKGEVLASLGCGNWRLFQLANGHKLTVDDFICAWVAAEEMRKRGFGLVRTGPFGQQSTTSGSSSSSNSSCTDDDIVKSPERIFHHADLGCGCGSVLMTLAWAFPKVIRSHGVEAQEVSYNLCRRGLEWNLGFDAGSQQEEDDHSVHLSHDDLRTWSGGSRAPYDLITGTPPYFPADRFVASENHSQKIRCRIPTRGAAADYVSTAARLVRTNGGVICIVETARPEGEQGMRQAIHEHGLHVERRLDVVTRTGLPPRFSCWVLTKKQAEEASVKDDEGASTKEVTSRSSIGCGGGGGSGGGGISSISTGTIQSSLTFKTSMMTTNATASTPLRTPSSTTSPSAAALPPLNDFPIETLTIRDKDQNRTLEYVEAMESMGWVDFEQTKDKRNKKDDFDVQITECSPAS